MKKPKRNRSVQLRIDKKRTARNLRSKAKRAHKMGTGYKELEDSK